MSNGTPTIEVTAAIEVGETEVKFQGTEKSGTDYTLSLLEPIDFTGKGGTQFLKDLTAALKLTDTIPDPTVPDWLASLATNVKNMLTKSSLKIIEAALELTEAADKTVAVKYRFGVLGSIKKSFPLIGDTLSVQSVGLAVSGTYTYTPQS